MDEIKRRSVKPNVIQFFVLQLSVTLRDNPLLLDFDVSSRASRQMKCILIYIIYPNLKCSWLIKTQMWQKRIVLFLIHSEDHKSSECYDS